ncbi:MAG: hypothetical protein R3Y23_06220 [Bacillota bacterium]
MQKNILVIWGGNSLEHEISIITGIEAIHNMPIKGYKAIPIFWHKGKFYTGSELVDIKNYAKMNFDNIYEVFIVGSHLYRKTQLGRLKLVDKIDCALLTTHGGAGENGTLQGFLASNYIPYTSCGVLQSALCMDKYSTKLRLIADDINVVRGELLAKDFNDEKIAEIEANLGYPLIIKPNSAGSSIGIAKANNRAELAFAIDVGFKYDDFILIEQYINDFIELNIACVTIGGKVVLSEIERPITTSEILTFDDKYSLDETQDIATREFPANISQTFAQKVKDITTKVYKSLALTGIVRIDYLLKGDILYLNEINTIPGSLSHYLFDNMSYSELLTKLLTETIKNGCVKEIKYTTDILSNFNGVKYK